MGHVCLVPRVVDVLREGCLPVLEVLVEQEERESGEAANVAPEDGIGVAYEYLIVERNEVSKNVEAEYEDLGTLRAGPLIVDQVTEKQLIAEVANGAFLNEVYELSELILAKMAWNLLLFDGLWIKCLCLHPFNFGLEEGGAEVDEESVDFVFHSRF